VRTGWTGFRRIGFCAVSLFRSLCHQSRCLRCQCVSFSAQSNLVFCTFTVRVAAKPVSRPVEPVLVSLPSRRRPFSLLSSLLSIYLSLISSSRRRPHFSLPLSPPPLKSLQKLSNLRGYCWRFDPLGLLHHLSTLLRDFRGRFHRSRYCFIFPIFDSIHTVLDYIKCLFKEIV
jgi:hypothetical protein